MIISLDKYKIAKKDLAEYKKIDRILHLAIDSFSFFKQYSFIAEILSFLSTHKTLNEIRMQQAQRVANEQNKN